MSDDLLARINSGDIGRDTIFQIEDIIKTELAPVEAEMYHYFAGGVYEREMRIKAGTLLTGKIHLTEHLAKLVSGTLRIWSESEQGIFTGPMTFVSHPGVKRLGYAETDVVFSTFHYVGEEMDLTTIENMLAVETEEQYLQHLEEKKCLS